jgi:hypothetical protein
MLTETRKPHWTQHVRGKRKPGVMNKTEAAYAQHLEGLKVMGQVEWFCFEGLSLKLGENCRYTPDFLVMTGAGFLECHEVKGFWAEAAKVRIKVAAAKFPFRFVAVLKLPKKSGGGWQKQEF